MTVSTNTRIIKIITIWWFSLNFPGRFFKYWNDKIHNNLSKRVIKVTTRALSPSRNLLSIARISLNVDYTARPTCYAVLAEFLMNSLIEFGKIPNNCKFYVVLLNTIKLSRFQFFIFQWKFEKHFSMKMAKQIVIVLIRNQSGEENILPQRLQCNKLIATLNKTNAFFTRRLWTRDVCCLWFHNANDKVKSWNPNKFLFFMDNF